MLVLGKMGTSKGTVEMQLRHMNGNVCKQLMVMSLSLIQSANQLLDCFVFQLFDWSRAWGFTSSTTVVHFISSLSLISNSSYPVIS